jgi:hypothetical protein
MKKITLLFILLSATFVFAQTNSTGMITLSTTSGLEYSGQIDVTASEVTLTLIGPDDRWLGMGFDASSMTSGQDVVIFDGTNLTDRTFQGVGSLPSLDANQDWTVQSNTAMSGVRTVVGTRPISTSDASDYDFNLTDTSLNIVWARGNGTFTLGYHGGSNKGPTVASFTLLGIEDASKLSFTLFPNPARDQFTLKVSEGLSNLKLEVYNVLGEIVMNKQLNSFNTNFTTIDVANWSNGIYLVKLNSDNLVQTKRFIKY